MDYKEEIRKLRTQMTGDFDFVTLAMRDMGVTFRNRMDEMARRQDETAERVNELGQQVNELGRGLNELARGLNQTAKNMNETAHSMAYLGREMEERFNQVEGRTRLQDQRFGQMLMAVEGAIDEWRPELDAVKARLDRLEERNNSAA